MIWEPSYSLLLYSDVGFASEFMVLSVHGLGVMPTASKPSIARHLGYGVTFMWVVESFGGF